MTDIDPREPLSNAKWENFCRIVVTGKSPEEAYEAAGWKRHRANAWRLRNRPEVSQRIEYMQRQAADAATGSSAEAIKAAGLTREWVLERLMQIAEEGTGRALTKLRIRVKKKDESKEKGGVEFIDIETTVLDRPAAKGALELLGKEMALFDGASGKVGEVDVEAAKSTADPRVADALAGVTKARLHLIADNGKKRA